MTMIDDGAHRVLLGVGEPGASWHEVDDGFWVGNTGGAFLGTIERTHSDRFFARDSTRAYVGEFPLLALAQAAVIEGADRSESGGRHAADGHAPRGRTSVRRPAEHTRGASAQ